MDSVPDSSTRLLRGIFITIADLPEGGGRTSRLRTLVRAFCLPGHEAETWNEHQLSKPGRDLASNAVQPAGQFAGVPYRYVLGTTQRRSGFGAFGEKFRAVSTICRWLRERSRVQRPDVLIINNLSFYDTYPITITARRLGIRTIQCYEDERLEFLGGENVSLGQRLFGLNSWLGDKVCAPMADAVVVISTYLKAKYEWLGVRSERLHIVPTIVDCDLWKLAPEPEGAVPTIFYSGTFGPQEDMDSMVLPLGKLAREGVPFRFQAAGFTPEQREGARRFLDGARREGFADRAEFLGFLSQDQLRTAMTKANLLVNLRKGSAFGSSGLSTKLSEYLASGRCVIASDVGDNKRYISSDRDALLIPLNPSADLLSTVLRRALTQPDLRRQIGESGRSAAECHFSVSVNAQLLDRIVRGVVAQQAAFQAS